VFWQELKSFYPYQEFVNSPNQKGFGIGLIHYSSTVELPSKFSVGRRLGV
jgi:hypothetical protein